MCVLYNSFFRKKIIYYRGMYNIIIIIACSVISNEEMIQFLPSFRKYSNLHQTLTYIKGITITTKLTIILSHVNY